MNTLNNHIRNWTFFGRMTGWFSSSVRYDFLNLPPFRKTPLLSRNWSNWLIPLLSGTILFSDFSCLISLTNDSACNKRKIFSWAFWIISVSMLLFHWFKTLTILFNQVPFITMISTIIPFIFIQLEVISCSLDNTELFWMLKTLAVTTFLTSGSSSDTSCNWLFSNQHCFLLYRKEGPSNHLFIWCFFLESNPREASYAEILLLST